MKQNKIHWNSQTSFLLATIGVAVGLGNIWRFPYIAGTHGGGAFILVYIASVLSFALPVLIAELIIGRKGQQNPVDSIKTICKQENRHQASWQLIGIFSILVPFLAFSYYSVIAGWTLDYFLKSLTGIFNQISRQESEQVFAGLLGSVPALLVSQAVFIALTAVIISKGLKEGLEKSVKVLMPGLFIILLLLVVCAAIIGDFQQGVEFLFKADFSQLSAKSVLVAMGQAFFSLGVGAGSVMAYGAYMQPTISIPRMSVIIAGVDTLVALLAGLAIFPFVFAFGLAPDSGPGLIFITLPIAFGNLPLGTILAALFFLLLAAAALTTMLSMLECITRLFEDRYQWSRRLIVCGVAFLSWLVGLLAVLSFNVLSDVFPLHMISHLKGKTFFDLMDNLVANILIPVNGLLIVIFAAWVMSKSSTLSEFGNSRPAVFSTWRFMTAYVVPIGIFSIFISSFL